MQSKVNVISLALAIVSLGVGGYAVLENQSLRAELEDRQVLTADGIDAPDGAMSGNVMERLQAVEEEVARVEKVAVNRVVPGMPSLSGREAPEPDDAGADADTLPVVEDPGKIESMVDAAVEKKAREIQAMANKKPALDVFAEVLDLTDDQRASVELEVVRGQNEVKALLETPTENGDVLMDDLVEIMATGMAKPGQARALWGKFFQRVTTEKVPGTDKTYAEQAEAVKDTVRSSFRRTMSEDQYAKFEEWKMDPTEVQGVADSPWMGLQERIVERARELGANIPGDDG